MITAAPVVRPHQRRLMARNRLLMGFVGALTFVCVTGATLVTLDVNLTGAANASDEKSLNRSTIERVMKIDRALRSHALRAERTSTQTVVPSSAEFLAFVRQLPDGPELLVNPWNRMSQSVNLPVKRVSPLLSPAHELGDGTVSVSMMMPLGFGHAPGGNTLGPLTYGTLAYDCDAGTGRYVLYGLGQAGNQAVVVHQTAGPR